MCSESFKELMQSTKLAQFTKMELPSAATGFVPFEMAQIMPKEFVPTELAQIPSVLFFTGWSNHQLILNRCKTNEERLFYIIYSKKELLGYKQLERAIKTDAMASILRAKDIQSEALHTTYAKSPALFKDTAYICSAIFGRFFTSDSSDKMSLQFYLKSHLFISSATSHPILRRSHHRSRHCNAPAPPMIIVFILVTSPTRAWRTATAT